LEGRAVVASRVLRFDFGLGLLFGAVVVLGALLAVAVGTARVNAAALPLDGPQAISPLVGSEIAVIEVKIHNSSHAIVTTVGVGTAVHVFASVDGIAGTPTGHVSSRLYPASGTCSGGAVNSAEHTLSAGDADITSLIYTPQAAGTVSFRVQYLGDATYGQTLSGCVALTVTKVNPVVTLVVHDTSHNPVASVVYGVSTVHPFVRVAHTAVVPTGTVHVLWYQNPNCTGVGQWSFGPFALVEGQVDEASFLAPGPLPGNRSFRAHYDGSSAVNPANSACMNYTVEKAIPTILIERHVADHTVAPELVTLGTPVHASVQISSKFLTQPTGDIVQAVYVDPGCSIAKTIGLGQAQPLIDPASPPQDPAAPVTLYFRVHYAGDALFRAWDSACLPVTWRAVPALSLIVHNSKHDAVSTALTGTTLHARVAVTGDFGTVDDGHVSVTRYANGTCSGSGTNLGEGSVAAGVLDDKTLDTKPTKAGSISFKAQYKGNTTYAPKTSACVKVSITAPAPTPGPTVLPTAAPPTAAPPSAVPSIAPSTEPQASTVPATTGPAETAAPGKTEPAGGSTSSPGETGTTGGATPGATINPGTAPSGDSGGGLWWLPLVLGLVLAVIGFGWWSTRRRREPG